MSILGTRVRDAAAGLRPEPQSAAGLALGWTRHQIYYVVDGCGIAHGRYPPL